MNKEELEHIVFDRFLEIRDKLPELVPSVELKTRSVNIYFNVVFSNSAIRTNDRKNMDYSDITPSIFQEIFENCEFVKDYFSMKRFDILTIKFTRNQFYLNARFEI